MNDLMDALKKNDELNGILVDTFLGLKYFTMLDDRAIDIQGFVDNPATHGVLFQVDNFNSMCPAVKFLFLQVKRPRIIRTEISAPHIMGY